MTWRQNETRVCPECQEQGLKSKVYPDYITTTAMYSGSGHWDEDGKWVNPPKMNTRTYRFNCSNKHFFMESEECW